MSSKRGFYLGFGSLIAVFLLVTAKAGAGILDPSEGEPRDPAPPRELQPRFERDLRLQNFLRGNTHTHSLRSDGDAPPERVVSWYRDHGYNFLVLTDHHRASLPGEFDSLSVPGRYIVVPGEEVTYTSSRDGQSVQVHANALCASATIPGAWVAPVSKAVQQEIDKINAQSGAVAQLNHPNFTWAIAESDLLALHGAPLLEVANQHPFVNNEGGHGRPSTEVLWDRLLTASKNYYGVADDDVHDVANPGQGRGPGKGWVQVAAERLEAGSICEALSRGDFYSSTGVELAWIEVKGGEYAFEIKPALTESSEDYRVRFIGAGGAVLSEQRATLTPSYSLVGDEKYVRAKVDNLKTHKSAWLQPVFVRN